MNNQKQIVFSKDIMVLPCVTDSYQGNGGIINLANPDFVVKNDSAASFTFNDKILSFCIFCGGNNFFDLKKAGTIPQKDLHMQGNTIAFYIQPNGKTNFYRFEFSARDAKSVDYYSKLKNGKYKRFRQKVDWFAKQEYDISSDVWAVTFDIPLDIIKVDHDKINGTRFLIVRYSWAPSFHEPIITNSMRLPANQLLEPTKWNVIMDKNMNDNMRNDCSVTTQMLNELKKKYQSELLPRGRDQEAISTLYVNLLNEFFGACHRPEYEETFRRLERFVNIPEFWGDDHKLQNLLHDLYGIHQFKFYGIIRILHYVMEGATFLANKELQEKQKKQNQHEYERLEQNKKKKGKIIQEKWDNSLIPCFVEIRSREKKAQRFGRKGPQLYFYQNCPRSWNMKFPTFRKKYAAWLEAGHPEKNKGCRSWQCPYAKKCNDFIPEI